MTGVVWKPVVGWEGMYCVSELGEVRGEARLAAHPAGGLRQIKSRVLKRQVDPQGYAQVSLCRDGRPKSYRVHTLVLEAFVGQRPEGQEGRHLNGIKDDCSLGNLQWGTPKQNAEDRNAHGTQSRGAIHGQAKLQESDFARIQADRRTQAEIAAAFGISQQNVSRIKRQMQLGAATTIEGTT